ncbi:hypothetical protein, partial [Pseudomonas protegens]|uniref:hypothetical protein n=1 Tax=Pseudomonas protegens TaxID=380021 RepID=UPI0022819BE3
YNAHSFQGLLALTDVCRQGIARSARVQCSSPVSADAVSTFETMIIKKKNEISARMIAPPAIRFYPNGFSGGNSTHFTRSA